MALDAVVDEIKEKGEREVAAIRSETQNEVGAILAAAQDKAASIKLAAEADVERQIAHIKNQEVSAANLVVKRELLNAQKELLDQVYEATVTDIARLPEDFHSKAVRELCKRAAKEIGEGTVYCNNRDKPAVEDALASLKTCAGFSWGGTVDIDGGIIAESKDGDLQLDYSYATFLAEVWETGLKDASEVLFG
jgi:V/A-type H+-transporting ATPase subunit E